MSNSEIQKVINLISNGCDRWNQWHCSDRITKNLQENALHIIRKIHGISGTLFDDYVKFERHVIDYDHWKCITKNYIKAAFNANDVEHRAKNFFFVEMVLSKSFGFCCKMKPKTTTSIVWLRHKSGWNDWMCIRWPFRLILMSVRVFKCVHDLWINSQMPCEQKKTAYQRHNNTISKLFVSKLISPTNQQTIDWAIFACVIFSLSAFFKT